MPGDGQVAENSKPEHLDKHNSEAQAAVLSNAPSQVSAEAEEVDDFGLPIRKPPRRTYTDHNDDVDSENDHDHDHDPPNHRSEDSDAVDTVHQPEFEPSHAPVTQQEAPTSEEASDKLENLEKQEEDTQHVQRIEKKEAQDEDRKIQQGVHDTAPIANAVTSTPTKKDLPPVGGTSAVTNDSHIAETPATATTTTTKIDAHPHDEAQTAVIASLSDAPKPKEALGPSEWSHQHVTSQVDETKATEAQAEDEWQEMPAYATHTIYDDWGKVVAREIAELDEEEAAYGHLGGAGKGYTKVQLDDDVQSATSMDEETAYLFKGGETAPNTLAEEEDQRDILSQMQATKDLLTEGQRIAYVGLVRLSMISMIRDLERLERTKGVKKFLDTATEAMQMWSQKMMVRLYSHMEIDAAEQIMIEQLAEHGVEPADLTPPLMQNARVKNPVQQPSSLNDSTSSLSRPSPSEPPSTLSANNSVPGTPTAPPPYHEENPSEYPKVQDPSELVHSKNIDLDLRWTVLCDLFLVLIADSVYDARSRALLELVGFALSVPWLDICRFEKRVTDALEMQEAADKENWNEDEHMDQRKKSARNRRLVMMGLATVGGGLVIGLSAGLLAPVIGAGLAAGFTTIGVAGTSGFLAGAGGAAIITSTGVVTGGTIAVRASNRRTGAVKTYEYRPLYNNKRVNLIVTVAGWMTGKVDDVRLPFSTVDPIMGDMYSVFWEPEMLRSMGDTINILATEALTQGLQQILGSTILIALMSAMQLPMVLTKLSYLIDNPWAVSLARADMAGLILADSLIDRNLGVRPITLVGFSIGSRVIYACLKELANRGAFGLVQNVYLFGSPMVVKKDEYLRARAVVSGRFVNGYANNDWILGYLFRATSGGIMRVAGLAPVEIPGIENHDVTSLVPGHMAYRKAMPRLLREVGWQVDSDEFAEIEDPDPDNHETRQRELINEIEEARRALEKKPEKKGLKALFGRNKKNAERKQWEVYEEKSKAESSEAGAQNSAADPNGGILFDIDAIRAEVADLAKEGIEVKEIKSTLPPMRLSLGPQSAVPNGLSSPPPALRQTRSFSGFGDSRPSSSNAAWGGDGIKAAASPRAGHFDYDYDEHDLHDDSNISMTFDDSPQQPILASAASPGLAASINGSSAKTSTVASQRPPLYSSSTMPVSSNNVDPAPERNAWADEEDEFGHEKQVLMTFE